MPINDLDQTLFFEQVETPLFESISPQRGELCIQVSWIDARNVRALVPRGLPHSMLDRRFKCTFQVLRSLDDEFVVPVHPTTERRGSYDLIGMADKVGVGRDLDVINGKVC